MELNYPRPCGIQSLTNYYVRPSALMMVLVL